MLDEFRPKWIEQKARPPVFSKDQNLVEEHVFDALRARGVEKLYLHQAEAIKTIKKGKDIVLMAPTAAGKTECYMLPVVEAALQGKCSLLLFPTKALSRDQWDRIREFAMLGVRSEVYDGDTPAHKRSKIRADMPHVIITNVDMLHYMLTNNRIWRTFFKRLKYVVIDEIHAYSGTLGSHVSNLMWRLQRLTEKEDDGAEVQFIVSSATIGNPREFAQKICNREFELIEGNSAPRAKIMHAVITQDDQSVVTSSIKIAKEMGRKTIIFANSHNMAERLSMIGDKLECDVQVYRSGLPPDERRKLEFDFKSGRVKMLAATSALELGMDVGDADLAILAGFPGTVTRLRQRIGRVGRKGQQAYAIFVAKSSPLDQYYANNPDIYLEGKAESCYAKFDNDYVRYLHLLSASKDKPLLKKEVGRDDLQILSKLEKEELVRTLGDSYTTTKEGTIKCRQISMRNAGQRIKILHAKSGKLLGERDISMAISELYPGAIYLLSGKRYTSLGLDLDEGVAKIIELKDDGQYYTQALKTKNAEILDTLESRKWGIVELSRGPVHISDEVYGYVIKDTFTGATVNKKMIEESLVHEYDTHALWADWDPWADGRPEFADGLHALEHVSISMMPAITGADPAEIGGISYPDGRVFYYEGVEGGTGLSEIIMPRYGEIIQMSENRLRSCKCETGCPSCVFSPQCGNNNYHLNKSSALDLVRKGMDSASIRVK
jgi:DEAD/DEAH box helicase domain-containing protein